MDELKPYIGDSVIEVNAGPGHATDHLLDSKKLLATDSDPVHVETLRRRFGHLENFSAELVDLDETGCDQSEADTAILFDGLQRSAEPKAMLQRVATCVSSGGHVLIQVPADPALFGSTDVAAGHVRRFEKNELADVVRAAGLELVSLEEFNQLGRVAWRLHHAVGAERISSAEATAFDLLVPLARRLDALRMGAGLSYLAVARVP